MRYSSLPSQQSAAAILIYKRLLQPLFGILCQIWSHMSALIYDHIAPLFLITLDRRRKKRVHNLAKCNQVLRPEQAAA